MSLQLILGSSGAGKSHYLYTHIIEESMKNPDRNYIVVVPEQYTMAIQKRLVSMHPRKGILNIDVVSFERLAYKVFEEVGEDNLEVLDDTGKNLIIKRVLEQNKDRLKYFGSNLSNTGFVSEMKSVISEMLQYDIKPVVMQGAAGAAYSDSEGSAALQYKLDDIVLVYNAFAEYIDKNYITKEEILDKLCSKVTESERIKNCEIAFDGFTGFTPVQYNLLTILLSMCPKIYVSLTIDASERENSVKGREELFFMSKDCVSKLYKICDEGHVKILEPVYISDREIPGKNITVNFNSRFKNSKELGFLEQNLFRNRAQKFGKETDNIVIYEGAVAREELTFAAGEIIRLTRLCGYRYNEIAIVTADMDGYGKLAANILKQNDIPYFLDYKRHVTDNPFIAAINGALGIIENNYSYDSILGFLRTGMSGMEREDIDLLDNYCVAVGIRGRGKWHEPWIRKFRGTVNNTDLEKLNSLRTMITDMLDPLEEVLKSKESNVADMVKALYEFLVREDMEQKVSVLNDSEYTGDEYAQLYKKVIEVLDKMYALLGSEKVGIKEFNKILASGFQEIKIGLIPQTNDCVVIGDIERTRLDNIKVMFFVGINDGNVPKKADSRSVLSESDREYLEDKGIVMSASVREKAFTQRFYLYLIMTKTSQKLYITYAHNSMDMKAILPSYIIRMIKKMFPGMDVLSYDNAAKERSYIRIPKAELEWSDENLAKILADGVALDLYGKELTGSVTSFEQYAACQYAYFCRYGLKLDEREEYKFAVNDFGTILHAVIEDVSKNIKQNKKSFVLLSDEERRKMVSESIHAIADSYGNTILKSTSRNEFLIKRMEDLADKTLWAIGKQLADGLFIPDTFEKGFLTKIEDLPHDVTFFMQGKIDRIDICEDDENVYVKVVDYKTGHSDFDLLKTYYGLKIQLFTYMREAISFEKKRHKGKNIVPAGLLYYNIDNPIVETRQDDDDKIEELIRKELRMKGVVNSNRNIISKLDSTEGTSLNIPVTVSKSGSIDASKSKVLTTEELMELGEYVDRENVVKATKILDGSININPYERGQDSSCNYCPYNSVCGFSEDMPGVKFRRLNSLSVEDIWCRIKEEIES